MAFTCPECGATQRGGKPGAVVACPGCRNPIVVPEPLPPKPPAEAPVAHAPLESSPQRLWGTATLVLVIVGAAHAGLYLLLTQEARSGIRALEQEHTAAGMRSAERPEAPPQPGTPEYGRWRKALERYDASKAWNTHRKHVSLLGGGFLASFLVQVGITVWILLKLLAKQKRRPPTARSRTSAA